MPEGWERQEGETEPAFAAFVVYRDQPMGSRSVRDVAAEVDKHVSLIGRWSSENRWVERVASWDAHLQRVGQKSMESQLQEALGRQANIARAFQQKVVARLQSIDPAELTPTQLVQWFDVAARVERAALGQPDLHVEMGISEGNAPLIAASRIIELRRQFALGPGDDDEPGGEEGAEGPPDP